MNKFVIPTLVKDPILKARAVMRYPVIGGGDRITYSNVPSNASGQSNSAFQITIPGENTFMSRRILIEMPVTVRMTANDSAQKIHQTGLGGFRAWPISNICRTQTAQINNKQFNIDASQTIQPLMKYTGDRKFRRVEASLCPSMEDYYQDYQQGAGTAKNPLAAYFDESAEVPRGAFAVDQVLVDTNTEYHATYIITESLKLSPFQFGPEQDRNGFVNIKTCKVDLNYVTQLFNKMWCRSSGATPILTGTITLGKPQLKVKFITPHKSEIITKAPVAVYPYFQVNRYSNSPQVLFAPGAQNAITSQTIQLQSIPSRFYIYVKRSDSDQASDVTNTDTYFNISSIRVNFDNNNSLLGSASEQDLYRMSVRHGYNGSFQDWHGVTSRTIGVTRTEVGLQGSVLCVVPGLDLQLSEGLSAGSVGQYNFQVSITCKNLHPTETITPEIFVLVVNQGILTLPVNGISDTYIGSIENRSLMDARVRGEVKGYGLGNNKFAYGGSFLGDMATSLWTDVEEGIGAVGELFDGRPGDAAKRIWASGKRKFTRDIPLAIEEGVKYLPGLIGGGNRGGKEVTQAQLMRRLGH